MPDSNLDQASPECPNGIVQCVAHYSDTWSGPRSTFSTPSRLMLETPNHVRSIVSALSVEIHRRRL